MQLGPNGRYLPSMDPAALESVFTTSLSVSGVSAASRPKTAPVRAVDPSKFQRKKQGGGGGIGGGTHGGLGGKHAKKAPFEVVGARTVPLAEAAVRRVGVPRMQPAVPKCDVFKQRSAGGPSIFRRMYERGDLPLRVNGGVQKFVQWNVGAAVNGGSKREPARAPSMPSFSAVGGDDYPAAKRRFIARLDYTVWLPLFFDGLRERADPYRFLACRGIEEMLEEADGTQVGPALPRLILPIRTALNTKEPETIYRILTALTLLTSVPGADPASGMTVGQLLVPYYRHILPIFNLFKSRASLASSADDYSCSIGEAIDECMERLASTGGAGAAAEITRRVPLWSRPPPRA